MKKYILAIDQGTTSTRAIIFDKNQNVVKVSQKEINVFFPHPSWVEQDALEIWLSTLSVIAGVFADHEVSPEEIEAIGITNQRETTVIWDKTTGIPIYNAIVWQSRQTKDLVDKYRTLNIEDKVKEKTGLILDPYFSVSKINWLLDKVKGARDNKNLLFGTIDTWLLWRMTNGKVHATDVTNASRTSLFNIHTLTWDEELLKIFNVPSYLLPEVKDTSGVFGYISKEHFFGTECPITALVGDQQAALFGESCFEKGEIKNTYGTGGFILMNTGDKVVKSNNGLLSTVAWKIKDEVKYGLEGSIFVSGSLIQWLRDGLKVIKNASEANEIAKEVPDSNGVIIVPAFTGMGAPYWNQECQGTIFGLTRGSDYRHIVRAALDAMAYQSKDLVDLMADETGVEVKELKVDGGGSRNPLLLKFQADILNIPVVKCGQSETTALGACRLAGLATGFFTKNDFKDEIVERHEPNMSKEEIDRLYARWKQAVQCTLHFKNK